MGLTVPPTIGTAPATGTTTGTTSPNTTPAQPTDPSQQQSFSQFMARMVC